MKKLFLLLFALIALTSRAGATDIDIGAISSIPGFNTANAGADAPLTGVVVNLASPNITCSSCLPQSAVGIGGTQITFSTGVRYTIATVTSRSAFTLTVNYAESSGTVTATLHKFVHLRIYALSSFIPSGSSTVVQAGAPGSSAWYRRYGVSIVNNGSQNVAFFPQVDDLPATTDSSNPTARYYAALYTQGGGFIQSYPGCVDDWRLSSTPTTTSWAQICTFNSSPVSPPPQPINFYTTTQIDSRFPSCSINQLIYYASTGNVQTCLTISGQFTISGGVLSLAAPATGYNQVQEEGSNLAQRATLNFIGSSFLAADEVGVRTNVTADADLNALASNATNGFWAAGTNIARTLTGTANEISITNGNGTTSNPVWSLPSALTFTGKTITGGTYSTPTITTPTITGGTHTAITGLGIRSTGSGAFDLTFANTENLTAGRTLTFTVNDAARTVNLGGNLTTANSFTTSGNNTLTLTTTGATNVTLPTTGTLATLAGTETFTSKTLTSPRIGVALLDTNGNEVIETPATASAVNQWRATNSATGNPVSMSAQGDDANIGATVSTKGAGNAVINTNSIDRVVVHGNAAESYFGNGITNATPTTYSINATGGSGTNIAGAHLDLAGGKGTGNADPGEITVRYPLRGASGTTLQSLSSSRFPVVTALYTNTNVGTSLTNTTTETSLFTGLTASAGSTRTLEGGFSKAGTLYRLRFEGDFTTTGTPTFQVRLKLGSTTISDSQALTMPTVSGRIELIYYFNVYSIGVGASTRCHMRGQITSAANGIVTVTDIMRVDAVGVDTTTSQTFDLTGQWGTAAAGNAVFLTGVTIERIR